MAIRTRAGLNRSEGRHFGLTVGLAFFVIGSVLLWRDHRLVGMVAATLGGLLVLMGLVAPDGLRPVRRVWMRLAHTISKVTTPIFMGIVYFFVVTPTGLIMRMVGKNPMTRPPGDQGWWRERDGIGNRGDMRRKF